MGPSIDNFQRPMFVEAPQLMVVMIAGAIHGGIILCIWPLSDWMETRGRKGHHHTEDPLVLLREAAWVAR